MCHSHPGDERFVSLHVMNDRLKNNKNSKENKCIDI